MGDTVRLCEEILGRPVVLMVVIEDTLGREADTERPLRASSRDVSPLCRLDEVPDVLPLRCRNPDGCNFDFFTGETASPPEATMLGGEPVVDRSSSPSKS